MNKNQMIKNWITENYYILNLLMKDNMVACPDSKISLTTIECEVKKIKSMCWSENFIAAFL